MLEWFGDRVADRAEDAAARGMVRTVDRAVGVARHDTPVLTGAAQASLRREQGEQRLIVVWGYHVRYGIFIEIGEQGRAGHHALRRAADAEYARLVEDMALEFELGAIR